MHFVTLPLLISAFACAVLAAPAPTPKTSAVSAAKKNDLIFAVTELKHEYWGRNYQKGIMNCNLPSFLLLSLCLPSLPPFWLLLTPHF